jgi:predicted DNA-binding transcriptional regulator AlpA
MFGLGQHISSATDTQELSLLHQAADLLGMDREPRKVPGLENSLRFGRSGQPVTLSGISKPTLRRLRQSSDFPAPTQLSDRAIGWSRDEIQQWIAARRAPPFNRMMRLAKPFSVDHGVGSGSRAIRSRHANRFSESRGADFERARKRPLSLMQNCTPGCTPPLLAVWTGSSCT